MTFRWGSGRSRVCGGSAVARGAATWLAAVAWLAAAITVTATAACRRDEPRALSARCREAVDARRDTAADLCLASYGIRHDAATGALAARALQSRDGALPIIEWIAGEIGDSPAGADAWFATGASRHANLDAAGALAAFQRAVAHRAAGDLVGRMRDAIGLLLHHQGQGEFDAAARQAAIAYELAGQVGPDVDRSYVYIDITSLLIEMGDLATAAQMLEQGRPFVPPENRFYAAFRELEGLIEGARDHPALEHQALLEAHAVALRRGDHDLEWDIRINLVNAAIRAEAFDDAARLLDSPPLERDASPNDRSIDAYFRGLIAIARERYADAVQLVDRVLPVAPDVWIGALEDVRGRALVRSGDAAGAERALVRAVAAVERRRNAVNVDTFKSWLLRDQREPFEDLFLLYVAADRPDAALDVVQRATARAMLDGLLEPEARAPSTARGIAAAGERLEGMRKLARSLRASPAAAIPPIAAIVARLHGHHVITYFRARRELWAITIASGGALGARRIGDARDLADRAASWRRHPEELATADELGAALLPDEILPPAGAALYIVADDPVAELSFAALRVHGEPVVMRHPVGYGPSAAVLSFARRLRSPRPAVVLGNPVGNLPHARLEAEEVAGALQVVPRLGADAVKAAVLDAGEAVLIHIAAHTQATPTGIALQLSDGLLDASAIVERGIGAGAIVLLSCSSAAIAERDELAPLASAFVAAGARTVVASRWAVEDDVARRFTRAFYRAGGTSDPVAALAAAQRQLVAERVPVAQWATFVVIGGIP